MAIDYQGMQRVREVAFFRPEIQSELARNGLHIVEWPRQEVPRQRVVIPCVRVIRQDFRLVVFGIERDGEQDNVPAQPASETLLQEPKIVGETETVIRQGTTCIDKVDGHDLAGKL